MGLCLYTFVWYLGIVEHIQFTRPRDGFSTPLDTELFANSRGIHLYCVYRESEMLADFPIGEPGSDQFECLLMPVRQINARNQANTTSGRRHTESAVGFHVIGHMRSILTDPEQQAGLDGVQPMQTEEVQTRHLGNAALLNWVAVLIEHRQIDP